jgi:hypothetical protein
VQAVRARKRVLLDEEPRREVDFVAAEADADDAETALGEIDGALNGLLRALDPKFLVRSQISAISMLRSAPSRSNVSRIAWHASVTLRSAWKYVQTEGEMKTSA